jgi:hypothetical protein
MTAIYRNDFTIWLMTTAFWAILGYLHFFFTGGSIPGYY